VTESRASITVWLTASAHDRLIKIANRNEQSVSAALRQILIASLRDRQP
jgi:cytidylate kinase